jgi:hypothetical protein
MSCCFRLLIPARGRRAQSLSLIAALALCACPAGDPSGTDGDTDVLPGDADNPWTDPNPPTDGVPLDTGLDPEPLRSGPFQVLFDNAHAENAGNANWVIDDTEPHPAPASPTSTESWKGAISSWGYELWQTGRYQVETLPPGGRFSFNDGGNTQDLSNFDLLVVPEPNSLFTSAEKLALLAFVNGGGGLFMIADHVGSDRNTDGYDSIDVWTDFRVNNGSVTDPFGLRFKKNSFSAFPGNPYGDGAVTNVAVLPDSRVLHGPWGEVGALSFHAASSLAINPSWNPKVRGLFWRQDYPQENDYVDFATSKYGNGRVAAVGDSSLADDNTGEAGKDLFNGWTEAGATNNIMLLNTTGWLVRDAGN